MGPFLNLTRKVRCFLTEHLPAQKGFFITTLYYSELHHRFGPVIKPGGRPAVTRRISHYTPIQGNMLTNQNAVNLKVLWRASSDAQTTAQHTGWDEKGLHRNQFLDNDNGHKNANKHQCNFYLHLDLGFKFFKTDHGTKLEGKE
jgi:hypothetical protein